SLGAIEAPSMNSAKSAVSVRPVHTHAEAGAAGRAVSAAVAMVSLPQRRRSADRLLGYGFAFGHGLHVHPGVLPDVAVGILEAAAVHEAEVLLGRRIGLAAGGHGPGDDRLDIVLTVVAEGEQHLGAFVRIRNRLAGEGLPELMAQQ